MLAVLVLEICWKVLNLCYGRVMFSLESVDQREFAYDDEVSRWCFRDRSGGCGNTSLKVSSFLIIGCCCLMTLFTGSFLQGMVCDKWERSQWGVSFCIEGYLCGSFLDKIHFYAGLFFLGKGILQVSEMSVASILLRTDELVFEGLTIHYSFPGVPWVTAGFVDAIYMDSSLCYVA